MRASIGSTIALSMLIAVMAQAHGTEDTPKTTKQEQSVSAFMRKKLELSQLALEGIVNEDFALIKQSANALDKLGGQKEFEVFPLDEYTHFSAEYRRIARSMGKEADKKNIDGSAMAYVQLTMSCVECHKFSRKVRMAQAAPFGKILTPQ
jgi:hypothetical protein